MPTLFESPTKPVAGQKASGRKGAKAPAQRTIMGPLTCYAVSPEGVRFETQEEQEEVVLFLRQHPIVLVPAIVILALMILFPTVILPIALHELEVSVNLPARFLIIGGLFWYLATFGFALISFLRWFFNIYIVTNQRVVDIDFKYLLYKMFSEANLSKIQDINYASGGIFAAAFNFGDVTVETAGEVPNIEFDKVPHPERVVQTISELAEDYKGTSP
ncbi:PH domain-containing protein [Candidatus Gottesmanbacteria bacterium]|nr:PH domain-containing protein [Candidatus Gottesmanbacteria bacterium]